MSEKPVCPHFPQHPWVHHNRSLDGRATISKWPAGTRDCVDCEHCKPECQQ